MFEGPLEELTLTENAQPALVAHSMAILAVLEDTMGFKIESHVDCVLGHSLGEFSALCAVNALTLEDTITLVRIRGKAMQEAVNGIPTKMVALLPTQKEKIEKLVQSVSKDTGMVCEIANINASNQIVISGHTEAVNLAVSLLSKTETRVRAIPLNVSAPFHCSLMQPAALALEKALTNVSIKRPLLPLISNVTACLETDPEKIKELMIKQVTSTVRWSDCIDEAIKQFSINQFIEIGPKQKLSSMIKKDPNIHTGSIDTKHDIEKYKFQEITH